MLSDTLQGDFDKFDCGGLGFRGGSMGDYYLCNIVLHIEPTILILGNSFAAMPAILSSYIPGATGTEGASGYEGDN